MKYYGSIRIYIRVTCLCGIFKWKMSELGWVEDEEATQFRLKKKRQAREYETTTKNPKKVAI